MTGKVPRLRFLLPAVFLLVGCSSRINRGGELTGTVRINGEPVTAGNVLLFSEDGELSVAGPIHSDGTYVVRDPPLGKVSIAVQTRMFRVRGPASPPAGLAAGEPLESSRGIVVPAGSERGLVYKAVPEKYEQAETSALTWTVGWGQNRHDLELSGQP
jgi:hypothetical protein